MRRTLLILSDRQTPTGPKILMIIGPLVVLYLMLVVMVLLLCLQSVE